MASDISRVSWREGLTLRVPVLPALPAAPNAEVNTGESLAVGGTEPAWLSRSREEAGRRPPVAVMSSG